MVQLSEIAGALTPHTFETPDELWEDWKEEIPRRYTPIGEGIVPLLAADLICRSRHRRSAMEALIDEGYFTQAELDAVLEGGLDSLHKHDQDQDQDQGNNQGQEES